jgi:hypothetical protein
MYAKHLPREQYLLNSTSQFPVLVRLRQWMTQCVNMHNLPRENEKFFAPANSGKNGGLTELKIWRSLPGVHY